MKNIRLQFGTRRLIALTSAVAVVMAMSIRIDAPALTQVVLAAYFMFFVGWAVMRGPSVYANLVEVGSLRRKLKDRRCELESEALELRRISEIAKSADDSNCRE